jgi:hypothetical protein
VCRTQNFSALKHVVGSYILYLPWIICYGFVCSLTFLCWPHRKMADNLYQTSPVVPFDKHPFFFLSLPTKLYISLNSTYYSYLVHHIAFCTFDYALKFTSTNISFPFTSDTLIRSTCCNQPSCHRLKIKHFKIL